MDGARGVCSIRKEKQPQILRLRGPQGTRPASLRMTNLWEMDDVEESRLEPEAFLLFGPQFGGLVLLAINLLENASVRDCVASIAGLVFMNFLFWVMFRMKDKELMRTGGKV